MQMTLLTPSVPVAEPNIEIRCCDVREMLGGVRDASLVISDPPWQYDNANVMRGDGSAATLPYSVVSIAQIVECLDAAYDSAANDAYLLTWVTFPKLNEFLPIALSMRWRYLSGGSWHKTGNIGLGIHLRGDSEIFILWAKGKPRPTGTLSNAYASPRTQHSEKPLGFLIKAIEALTEPDDLVVSVYSGMAPEARACKATGRRMIGAEIDPERHSQAISKLAQYRP